MATTTQPNLTELVELDLDTWTFAAMFSPQEMSDLYETVVCLLEHDSLGPGPLLSDISELLACTLGGDGTLDWWVEEELDLFVHSFACWEEFEESDSDSESNSELVDGLDSDLEREETEAETKEETDETKEETEETKEEKETKEETKEETEETKEETKEEKEERKRCLQAKIQNLREIPQPVQRTPEWYAFRWNLITASNAWKAFGTQSSINQLIYEKCKPVQECVDPDAFEPAKMVNTHSPMHWGQKYEPLSVLLYEHKYGLVVEDFGCIQHPTYSFLGASPDGIITGLQKEEEKGLEEEEKAKEKGLKESKEEHRVGRMLEIKNIVNREITGIPKKEYWVQMQLQMEVCDLDECDFLETKFTEYASFDECKHDDSRTLGTQKGVIIYYIHDGKPLYQYMPPSIDSWDRLSAWEEQRLQTYQDNPLYTFVQFMYWKLERWSCVLIQRDRPWFANHVGQLAAVWKTIEQERVSGYAHRAPVRRNPNAKKTASASTETSAETCYLQTPRPTPLTGFLHVVKLPLQAEETQLEALVPCKIETKKE